MELYIDKNRLFFFGNMVKINKKNDMLPNGSESHYYFLHTTHNTMQYNKKVNSKLHYRIEVQWQCAMSNCDFICMCKSHLLVYFPTNM